MSEFRNDTLRASGEIRFDARGFAIVPAFLTRTGVFPYKRADGSTVRELRHPDDVFHEDSLATYEGAPVTELHPGESVSPANVRKLEVGVAMGVRRDGKHVAGNLSIRDGAAIQKVKEKKAAREISCGYSCRIDAQPGTYEGEPYDQIQRDIRINHIAYGPVGWGRAGAEVRFRHDAASAVLDPDAEEFAAVGGSVAGETAETTPTAAAVRADQGHGAPGQDEPGAAAARPRGNMKKIRIDGVEYEVDDKIATAYEAERSRADGAITRADSAQTREDTLRGERDAANATLTTVRGELTAAVDPAKRADSVRVRVGIERAATKVLGEAVRFDDKTDRQIMEQAITAADKAKVITLAGRSDDYVAAIFDSMVVHGAAKRNDGLAIVNGAANAGQRTIAPIVRQDGTDATASADAGSTFQSRLDAVEKKINSGSPASQVV